MGVYKLVVLFGAIFRAAVLRIATRAFQLNLIL